MRIAVLSDFSMTNSRYRSFPLCELVQRGHDVTTQDCGSNIDARRLLDADVVHVHRYHDAVMQEVLRWIRSMGVAVVWDNDDRSGEGPMDLKRGALRHQRLHRDIARTLRSAHVVTTTSEALAEMFGQLGAERVVKVENFLPASYDVRAPRRRDDGLVIGWVAAFEHVQDAEQLRIRELLLRLLERHHDLRVEMLGVDLRLPPDRYSCTPWVAYPDLGKRIAAFDIGISPLCDVPFNRARSDVKVKEYGYARVPWLASPIGPYAGLGERQGGRLVADDGWEDALERLIASARDRRRLAKRGRQWAEGKTAARNLVAWEAVLEEAVERARSPAMALTS